MKKCHLLEIHDHDKLIDQLLTGNGIATIKKASTLGDQEALEAYKEVLDLLAEIIADDIIKRRKADG